LSTEKGVYCKKTTATAKENQKRVARRKSTIGDTRTGKKKGAREGSGAENGKFAKPSQFFNLTKQRVNSLMGEESQRSGVNCHWVHADKKGKGGMRA